MLIRTATILSVLLAPLTATSTALANEYETFIDIETEEDLYDLQVEGQIDEDTFTTLRELYQRGVDLNNADRELLYSLPNLSYQEVDAILAYRAEVGFIENPAALVVNGVLPEEKVAAIAPFLIVSKPEKSLLGVKGFVQTQTRWSQEDDQFPPMSLRTRVDTARNIRVGAAAFVTRNRLGDVVYDPGRDALTAEDNEPRPYLPKAYVHLDDQDYAIIAGTYRIGFGQRLTFDVTSQLDPNGFYGDDEVFRDSDLTNACKQSAGELPTGPCTRFSSDPSSPVTYISPDYRWRDSMLGVAVGLKDMALGGGKSLQVYGFGSYQPKGIYQYELWDRGKCSDPNDDDSQMNLDCGAPDVYRTGDDPFAPTSEFSFQTLPNMYAEMIGGGNVTVRLNRRAHVGVTGYGAYVNWLTEGIDLDFQEWSRTPYGGPFGAVGVNGAYGFDKYDFFIEVARSFDSQPETDLGDTSGGGFGAVLRQVTSWDKNEVEASLRYYDAAFNNPYARPISAPDEFNGLRARDEVGARLRATSRLKKRFSVRGNLDVWRAPDEEVTEGIFYVRGDADLTKVWGVGVWTLYQNKGLGRNVADGEGGDGVARCFFISVEENLDGEPIPCSGQKYQATGRVRWRPNDKIWASLQYTHEVVDDDDLMDAGTRFRQDVSGTAIVTAKPANRVRLRSRARYFFEDIADNGRLEQSIWVNLDATYRLREKDRLRVRYDYFDFLDERSSTQARAPSPEHWLWFEYMANF